MKLQLLLTATLVLAAGTASAQGYGTFAPNKKPPASTTAGASPYTSPYKSPYSAPSGSGASTVRSHGAPATETFKPYKSQTGTSVFGPDGKKKR